MSHKAILASQSSPFPWPARGLQSVVPHEERDTALRDIRAAGVAKLLKEMHLQRSRCG